MPTRYSKHVAPSNTPQSEPLHGEEMEKNAAGGYVYAIDKWAQAERFLILGSAGGTYYVTEHALTVENAKVIEECAAEDIGRMVALIVNVSDAGRAPKQSPAIFALALLSNYPQANEAMPLVCRTASQLMEWWETVKSLNRTGRSVRRAVSNWYNGKTTEQLWYQITKYKQRVGWSHRDILRVAHVEPKVEHEAAFRYMVTGQVAGPRSVTRRSQDNKVTDYNLPGDSPVWDRIGPYLELQRCTDPKRAAALVREHKFVREHVPNELLNKPAIWEALLPDMPAWALLRNLATMTRIGLIAPLSEASKTVMNALSGERCRHARVHPIQVLIALRTYAAGRGFRGNNTWAPEQSIVAHLDSLFYDAFQWVEPTEKRFLVGVDISGSMYGGHVAGTECLDAATAAAAMAMLTARTEPNHHLMAFTDRFEPLGIHKNWSLDAVINHMRELARRMAGTDCALPMLYATEKKIPVDVFQIITDNETWAGSAHPMHALREYRRKMGIPAKLLVLAVSGTSHSIADPKDRGTLDVSGFDGNVPTVMNTFALE